jgi:RNA 2',3'-cyclic 3'-phosphodiesterase
MTDSTADNLRLFFGLRCPPAPRSAIAQWRDGLGVGGKPGIAENFHLTLAFLGMQPASRLPWLQTLAGSLQCSRFELVLDSLQLWPNGILHLAPTQAPPALLQLAMALRNPLQAAAIGLDEYPWQPHLTLARHCRQLPDASCPGFAWQVEDFALFLSASSPQGVRYQILDSWPLQDPACN